LNIFYVDRDPVKAAQSLCDKHVIKMTLESAQLLSGAAQLLGSPPDDLYKLTHRNHPCAVWARKSVTNFNWLIQHGIGLSQEYTYRYGRIHKSSRIFYYLLDNFQFPGTIQADFDEPPLAMPDHYRTVDNKVLAYRNYYIGDKLEICRWTKREPPAWILPHLTRGIHYV
jgi:hypothetical protein